MQHWIMIRCCFEIAMKLQRSVNVIWVDIMDEFSRNWRKNMLLSY